MGIYSENAKAEAPRDKLMELANLVASSAGEVAEHASALTQARETLRAAENNLAISQTRYEECVNSYQAARRDLGLYLDIPSEAPSSFSRG